MRRLLLLLAFAALAAGPATAQTFNAQEQAEIRAIVREYLVNNPDVLREALDALEARVDAQRWREVRGDPRDFSIGPANAPIVIVEYFDYRCPYCHAAYEWIYELTRTRSDVRVVLKEFPVLGPDSMQAAQAALAAMPQGRYWQFHRALITHRGELSSARIDQLARGAGIDVARMRRAMSSPEIIAQLEDIRAQAIEYNFTGTPGFVINGETVPGFSRPLLEQRLREATREARNRRQDAN
ncbi:MAG: DsbA family protein [Hyphomonadaceae bacterium]